jgi:hypothetical protein
MTSGQATDALVRTSARPASDATTVQVRNGKALISEADLRRPDQAL